MEFNNSRNPIMKTFSKVNAVFATLVLTAPFGAFAGHTNTVLEANLNGSQEFASKAGMKIGDKNGKGTAYVFGIDGDPTTLCYFLEVSKIQLVPVGKGMAAHIHKGKEGQNGPVVANLAGPEDGNAADCLTQGEKGKFPTGELVKNILENPEYYYINVHNPKNPEGAIRGQLFANIDEGDHTHDAK